MISVFGRKNAKFPFITVIGKIFLPRVPPYSPLTKLPAIQVETLLDAYIDKFWFVHNIKVERKELEREKLREAGNPEKVEDEGKLKFWLEDDMYVFLYYNSFLVQ